MSKIGKKVKRKSNPPEEVVIEVAQDDYRREVKRGVKEEHALKPGRHVFRRGGFKARHASFDSSNAAVKIQVNIRLDREVLEYFKKRAKSADATKYEIEINNALRSLINGEKARRPRLRSVG